MKIRNGFVSNSSSSSFIISNEHFSSIRELAKYMIGKQIEEETYYNDVDIIEYRKEIMSKLDNIDENTSVCFPSCNYDTYVKKFGDCYLVSTCNNTNWDLDEFTTRLTKEAINALIDLSLKSTEKISDRINYILEGDYYDFPHIGKDYYDLRNELFGIETFYYCPNKELIDHGENYYIWDTVKYGKICLVCNHYWKRKEKLNIINSKVKK